MIWIDGEPHRLNFVLVAQELARARETGVAMRYNRAQRKRAAKMQDKTARRATIIANGIRLARRGRVFGGAR